MKTVAAVAVAMLLAACASAPVSGRTPPVPLGPASRGVDVRDDREFAAADRSAAVVAPVEPAAGGGVSVSYRTVTVVEQAPSPAPAPAAAPAEEPAASWSSGTSTPLYSPGYVPYGYADNYRYEQRDESWFPYGTAIGIGIGAAFDHYDNHHGCGHGHGHDAAWIGGSIGLMYDLGRWLR